MSALSLYTVVFGDPAVTMIRAIVASSENEAMSLGEHYVWVVTGRKVNAVSATNESARAQE